MVWVTIIVCMQLLQKIFHIKNIFLKTMFINATWIFLLVECILNLNHINWLQSKVCEIYLSPGDLPVAHPESGWLNRCPPRVWVTYPLPTLSLGDLFVAHPESGWLYPLPTLSLGYLPVAHTESGWLTRYPHWVCVTYPLPT